MKGKKLTILVNISILSNLHKIDELINLHNDYSEFGLLIIAFPTMQFEDSLIKITNEQVIRFTEAIQAKFLMSEICDVNGSNSHPIFMQLRKRTPCFKFTVKGKIKNIPNNFCKFFIDSSGSVVHYQNQNNSLHAVVDEVEIILGLRGSKDK